MFVYLGLVRLIVERYGATVPTADGLASEATLQDTLSAVEVFLASIRGTYSCPFAVAFSLSIVIGVPASPA
jgi:hypothetical protein